MPEFLIIIALIAGTGIGATAAWWIQHFRLHSDQQVTSEDLELRESKIRQLESELATTSAKLNSQIEIADTVKAERVELQTELDQFRTARATLEQQNHVLQTQLKEERGRMESLNTQLKADFKNLASEILHTTTTRLTQTQHERLGEVLNPLKTEITGFRQKIEQGQKEQAFFKGELKEQFESLKQMNHQLSDEAKQLSNALRGQNKTAGDWGEMILERILNLSGLVEGREYQAQHSDKNEDGKAIRPDVIIRYPDKDGALVIDSKVSLTAYTDYFNADDDKERDTAAMRHLQSIKNHIDGIANKKYETAQGLNTPEFILVFLPVEGALTLAMQQEPDLYDIAFRKNIILITPSTLLATLKLVKNLWKQDDQNKNARKIAEEGAGLYDKFETFYRTLQDIEKHFKQAQTHFTDAKKQLAEGRGNVIARVERLKKLGANAKKTIEPGITQQAIEEDLPENSGTLDLLETSSDHS